MIKRTIYTGILSLAFVLVGCSNSEKPTNPSTNSPSGIWIGSIRANSSGQHEAIKAIIQPDAETANAVKIMLVGEPGFVFYGAGEFDTAINKLEANTLFYEAPSYQYSNFSNGDEVDFSLTYSPEFQLGGQFVSQTEDGTLSLSYNALSKRQVDEQWIASNWTDFSTGATLFYLDSVQTDSKIVFSFSTLNDEGCIVEASLSHEFVTDPGTGLIESEDNVFTADGTLTDCGDESGSFSGFGYFSDYAQSNDNLKVTLYFVADESQSLIKIEWIRG